LDGFDCVVFFTAEGRLYASIARCQTTKTRAARIFFLSLSRPPESSENSAPARVASRNFFSGALIALCG
jgi:hypothetical protein